MAKYILKKRPYLGKVKKRSRIFQTFGAWQTVARFETLKAAGIALNKIMGLYNKQIFYRGKPVDNHAIFKTMRSTE